MNTSSASLRLAACLIGIALALSACSRQTAQEKGTEMATEKLDIAIGVGDALQTKGAAAGESVAAGVGTVIKGLERGVLKSGREIVADKSLQAAGLSITRVQEAAPGDKPTHGFDAYVIASAPAAGTLRMLAFDALGKEIGRASVKVELGADASSYLSFPLAPQVSLGLVSKVAFAFQAADKPGA